VHSPKAILTSSNKQVAALLAVLAAACLFLLLFHGGAGAQTAPETLGRDVVQTAADFQAGDLSAAAVKPAAAPGGAPGLVIAAAPDAPAPGSQGEYVSPVLQAEFSFNALGLHWLADTPDGSAVAADVRLSRDGSTWDEWQPVTADADDVPDHIAQTRSAGETIGQLVYGDEARYFQYRLKLTAAADGRTPQVQQVTASYIDAKGYSQSTPLAFVAGLPARMVSMLSPQEAGGAQIITRAQWGANEAQMTWDPQYAAVKKEIIHHAVTSNSDPDPAATVRSIYYYHAVSLGWGDIGYNFLIDRQGRIYQGRKGGANVIGGHAYGWNNGSVGICALGNYETVDINSSQYTAFVELMSDLASAYGINPNGSDYFVHYSNGNPVGGYPANFLGHRDTYSTACPGAYLYPRLPQFRADAAARIQPNYPIDPPFSTKWNALGGAPGRALSAAYSIPGGAAQSFERGRLIYVQGNGLTNYVMGGILGKYDAIGAWNGFMGLPWSDEYGVAGGRANDFSAGKIYYSGSTGAHFTIGAILGKYLLEGGPAHYGFPVSDEYDVPGVGGARESDFQHGRIYWHEAHQAHVIYGAILARYLRWPASALGIPVTDEYDVPGRAGARESDLSTGARIYWSGTTGSGLVIGDFLTEHQEAGGPAGYMGLPIGDPFLVRTGSAQQYENATITWRGPGDAHAVYGGVRAKYLLMGGPAGGLGVAAADEMAAPGVAGAREADFVGGRIYWSPSYGSVAVYGAILGRYAELGGSATMGVPVSDEHDIAGVAGGRQSDFQANSIYWSGATGAWEVRGAIAAKWQELGGPPGELGLPVSGELATAASGQMSAFQHGRIYWSDATGAHAVIGAVLNKYLELGGPASELGLPISDEYDYESGRRSDFTGGSIYWTATEGTSVVIP
jgi:uncharacterized protein with LGFP repeats